MSIHAPSTRLRAATLTCAVVAGTSFTWLATPATAVVPISIDAGPDATVVEGSALVRTVAIIDEVDDGDAGWSYTIDYGDGLVTTGTTTVPSLTLDHAYANGPATFTAIVTVTDVPGDVTGDTVLVTVQNVMPVVTITGVASTPEGSTYQLTVAGSDAGVNDRLFMAIDWNDGSLSAQVLAPLGTVAHVFRDDEDGTLNATVRNVQVTVYDDVSLQRFVFPVTVTDVAPTIAVTGAATATSGLPYQLTLGAITDPGVDTVTSRTIRWGDGTSDIVSATGTYVHTFASGGARTISVDLVDEDGTHLSAGVLPVVVASVPPTAPAALVATALSKSTVDLRWTNTSSDQTSITVQRCKGSTCTNFATIATLPGTATTYRNSGLSGRTTYRYRVRATNVAGSSPYSAPVSATTLR